MNLFDRYVNYASECNINELEQRLKKYPTDASVIAYACILLVAKLEGVDDRISVEVVETYLCAFHEQEDLCVCCTYLMERMKEEMFPRLSERHEQDYEHAERKKMEYEERLKSAETKGKTCREAIQKLDDDERKKKARFSDMEEEPGGERAERIKMVYEKRLKSAERIKMVYEKRLKSAETEGKTCREAIQKLDQNIKDYQDEESYEQSYVDCINNKKVRLSFVLKELQVYLIKALDARCMVAVPHVVLYQIIGSAKQALEGVLCEGSTKEHFCALVFYFLDLAVYGFPFHYSTTSSTVASIMLAAYCAGDCSNTTQADCSITTQKFQTKFQTKVCTYVNELNLGLWCDNIFDTTQYAKNLWQFHVHPKHHEHISEHLARTRRSLFSSLRGQKNPHDDDAILTSPRSANGSPTKSADLSSA